MSNADEGEVFIDSQQKKGQVFLCYGHDDACTELVEKFRKDLLSHGWVAWIDKDIPLGKDWRDSITEAALNSQHMLAFMTQHSMRSPGVCRQEVALALGPANCHIYTVLLEPWSKVNPPLIVSNIQWLDMNKWQEERTKENLIQAEDLYQESLQQVLSVLEENRPFSGHVEKLKTWLRPIDSKTSMLTCESNFVGRRWLLDGLVDELDEIPTTISLAKSIASEANVVPGELEKWRFEAKERVFWLTAPPGWGKSAISAQLAHSARSRVLAVHFCKQEQPDTCDARSVIRSIAFQMATQLADYRKWLIQLLESNEDLENKNSFELFRELISNALSYSIDGERAKNGKLLIVIDGLDETLNQQGQSDLLMLIASEFGRLPSWLGLVVTSRDEPIIRRHLSVFGINELSADDPRNLADMREYVRFQIEKLSIGVAQQKLAYNSVMKASDGIFLYVSQLFEAVQTGNMHQDELMSEKHLPKGLSGLYERWFSSRFPDEEIYKERIRPFLDLMLASQGSLPVTLIERMLNWDRDDSTLRNLGSLCLHETGSVRLFHRSLIDWLNADKFSGSVYTANSTEGHLHFARYLFEIYLNWKSAGAPSSGGEDWLRLGPKGEAYAIAHLPTHLLAAGKNVQYQVLLKDIDFMMRCLTYGQVGALLSNYHSICDKQPECADLDLRAWAKFWFTKGHLLQRTYESWPSQRVLLQLALETAADSVIFKSARAWMQSHSFDWPVMYAHRRLHSSEMVTFGKVIQAPHFFDRKTLPQFSALALSTDANYLLAGMKDGRVFKLRLSDYDLECIAQVNQEISHLASAGVGDIVAASTRRGSLFQGFLGSEGFLFNSSSSEVHAKCLSFSPDCCDLAYSFKDRVFKLSALHPKVITSEIGDAGGEFLEINCGQGDIGGLDWAGNGKIFATVGDSGNVKIWDLQDGNCKCVIEPCWDDEVPLVKRRLTSVALSQDGRVGIAGSVSGLLWMFDTQDSKSACVLIGHTGSIYSVDITPDGRRAVSGGADGVVRVWDLDFDAKLEFELEGHGHLVTSTLIDQTGEFVYSAGTDGTLRAWPLSEATPWQSKGESVSKQILTTEVCSLTQDSGGTVWVGHKNGAVQGINPTAFTTNLLPTPHESEVWAISKTVNDTGVITAGFDQKIRLWNSATGKIVIENNIPLSKVYGLDASSMDALYCWGIPDKASRSKLLDNSAIKLPSSAILELNPIDLSIQTALPISNHGYVRALRISSTKSVIYAGGQGGFLHAFDSQTGSTCWEELNAHRNTVYAIALSPNGRQIASAGSDRMIQVRDAGTGRMLREIAGHTGAITSLFFSANGLHLISSAWDGTICLWDIRKGVLLSLAHIPNVSKVLLLNDGISLLAGTTSGNLISINLINSVFLG